MIDEIFISAIPSDFNYGLDYIVEAFFDFNKPLITSSDRVKNHDEFIEFYFALEAFLIANKFDFKPLIIDTNKVDNVGKIFNFFTSFRSIVKTRLTSDNIEKQREKFHNLFNNTFNYEFSQGDLDRIQTLLNEIRNNLSSSELFTAEHKQRLLKRLEKLQAELHKKVSDLDRFWGLIGDAGVAIGKFGRDAKPLVDRIREIADIVWRTQARAEELPSGSNMPFLHEANEDEGKNQ